MFDQIQILTSFVCEVWEITGYTPNSIKNIYIVPWFQKPQFQSLRSAVVNLTAKFHIRFAVFNLMVYLISWFIKIYILMTNSKVSVYIKRQKTESTLKL